MMKVDGEKPVGLEVGNAWDLRAAGAPTNWIVGETPQIPSDSLRFMQRDNPESGAKATKAKNLGVKWFVHNPGDQPEWGSKKPTSGGRTISLLAGAGEFELVFSNGHDEFKVTLDEPGDFAIWGAGLEHAWKPIKTSTIVTVRWEDD